jgi:acetyl esterase/lipase
MFRCLIFAIVLFALGCGGPVPSGAGQRTVTYCATQQMELHGNRDVTQAAVLYVHGGGWESGNRTTGFERRMIGPLTDAGFVVATIDYRLAPGSRHPAQAQDVACAVRYLRANAAALGIDPRRIGIMGDSAGGHLAALTAMAGERFTGAEWVGVSAEVQAVAAFYGIFDLVNLEPSLAQAAVAQNFPNAEARVSGSPAIYVDRTAPPFLLAHGKEDRFVDVAQSVKMAVLLQNAGHDPLLVAVDNAGHGFVPRGGEPAPSVPQITALTVAFFVEHLARP